MYAIVDIETTGGHASASSITEIAIVVHDGQQVVDTFHSLVNPEMPIPRYIQALTGITDEMVSFAPTFSELAPKVFELLQPNVFIAHNVNFDYSFIKHQLDVAGFAIHSKKLCTVRMSRKIFPGMPSYSLGNLCRQLGITIQDRHRAHGDAAATVQLFEKLLANDTQQVLASMLKVGSKEQALPANLPREQVLQLPNTPGVYYFHDQKGKVVYVGKAINIRKRVLSHFSGNNPGKQRQDFLRNIYQVSHQVTGTELIAFILESIEIKRLWPAYNRAQKHIESKFGIYVFEDQQGYMRLAIEKKRKYTTPILGFNLMIEGRNRLIQLVKQFNLCHKLCFLQADTQACTGLESQICKGACEHREDADTYNSRVFAAIRHLQEGLATFAIIDNGLAKGQHSCVYIEKGKFYGMGYIPSNAELESAEFLKEQLTQYPENDYILNLVHQYASVNTKQIVRF